MSSSIAFPNRINRSRLVGPIELDSIVVISGAFVIFYALGMFVFGSSMGLLLIFSGSISAIVGFLYNFYKKNAKKGFLMHWFYVNNIYFPKYKGIEKLPENFLSKGYEYEFRD